MTAPGGGTIANPGTKPVLARGTATAGSAAVAAVDVAVQMNGASGPWWNARKHAWQQGPAYDRASLGPAGGTRTWSFGVPALKQGSVLTFTARAVGADGLVERRLVQRTVTVRPVATGPRVTLSAGQASPGGSMRVTGHGFGSGEKVTLSLPGAVLATATARADGSFGPWPTAWRSPATSRAGSAPSGSRRAPWPGRRRSAGRSARLRRWTGRTAWSWSARRTAASPRTRSGRASWPGGSRPQRP